AVLPSALYLASYHSWFGGPRTPHGGELARLTQAMYQAGSTLPSPHCDASPWWSWPLALRGVYLLFHPATAGTTAFIYDVGNPLLFWLALPAGALVAGIAIRAPSAPLALVLLGILTQLLAWAPISRNTFSYYFVSALPFYLLALAIALALVWERRRGAVIASLAVATALSLFLYPIVSAVP